MGVSLFLPNMCVSLFFWHRWTLVFEDLKSSSFNIQDLEDQTNFLEMTDSDNCCIIMNKKGESQ